jgi:putative DNA methylase
VACFEVRTGNLPKARQAELAEGTIGRKGGCCLLTGVPMPFTHIRAEGKAGRMGERLIAVVADGPRGRIYLVPTAEHERIAREAEPSWKPDQELPDNPRDFKTPSYGMRTFGDLFTPRQLVALTTFSDLVDKARAKVAADAHASSLDSDPIPLADGGRGAEAYADAVAVYLAFAVDKASTRNCSLAIWEPGMGRLAGAMGRQALPMQWSYAEANPLAGAGGDIEGCAISIAEFLGQLPAQGRSQVFRMDEANLKTDNLRILSTDPPYYDNIVYADLSNFFYVWMRQNLRRIFPKDFCDAARPQERGAGRNSLPARWERRGGNILHVRHEPRSAQRGAGQRR